MLGAVLLCLVVGISDGDTLTARCGDATLKVRLADIDAPEAKQPFGTRSRQHLAALCFKRSAEVQPVATDRYGRTVARVYCQGADASAEQVRAGMAWVFLRYAPKDSPLYVAEREAKSGRRGLWSQGDPVTPWDWRRRR